MLKDLIKPPFATYDVVVYFGGGLFSLPFIYRYILEPLAIRAPSFIVNEFDSVSLEIVRILTIVTFVYVLGHLLAYLSSQLVEKALDRFLGKVSTAILVSVSTAKALRNQKLRDFFKDRTRRIKSEGAIISSIVRGLFHFPNFIAYFIMYSFGIFGYFDSRLPQKALERVESVYTTIVIPGELLTSDKKWFKSLEYFVINRIPMAGPRMYNYLVIAGLFRSLSFVFLISCWWMLLYLGCYMLFDTWPIQSAENYSGQGAGIFEFFTLSILSVFCLVAYIKFQRRYAEEAMLALAFSKDP